MILVIFCRNRKGLDNHRKPTVNTMLRVDAVDDGFSAEKGTIVFWMTNEDTEQQLFSDLLGKLYDGFSFFIEISERRS